MEIDLNLEKQTANSTYLIRADFKRVAKGFSLINVVPINTKDHKAVILHVINENDPNITIDNLCQQQELENFSCNSGFFFNEDLKDGEKIRVFYWNDASSVFDANEVFNPLLKDFKIDDRVPLGRFNLGGELEVFQPKEAGNGGVVGITGGE